MYSVPFTNKCAAETYYFVEIHSPPSKKWGAAFAAPLIYIYIQFLLYAVFLNVEKQPNTADWSRLSPLSSVLCLSQSGFCSPGQIGIGGNLGDFLKRFD